MDIVKVEPLGESTGKTIHVKVEPAIHDSVRAAGNHPTIKTVKHKVEDESLVDETKTPRKKRKRRKGKNRNKSEKRDGDEITSDPGKKSESMPHLGSDGDNMDDDDIRYTNHAVPHAENTINLQPEMECESGAQFGSDEDDPGDDLSGTDHPLPENWRMFVHDSGLPIYMNVVTRVCTVCPPRVLRRDELFFKSIVVPPDSIPCYASVSKTAVCPEKLTPLNLTEEERKKMVRQEDGYLVDYMRRLFEYRVVHNKRYKTWKARRTCVRKAKKVRKEKEIRESEGNYISVPLLKPVSEKVEEVNAENCPASSSGGEPLVKKPDKLDMDSNWMTKVTESRGVVGMLHEYLQASLKKRPTYKEVERDNSIAPFSVTVVIDDYEYGIAGGCSKKDAKLKAAKLTVEALCPEMGEKILGVDKNLNVGNANVSRGMIISTFGAVNVTDPRVLEFSKAANTPLPYELLYSYLKLKKINLKMEFAGQEFAMKTDKHETRAPFRLPSDRKVAKHYAAQAMLQKYHPLVTNWGSLLHLYFDAAVQMKKDGKGEEDSSDDDEEEDAEMYEEQPPPSGSADANAPTAPSTPAPSSAMEEDLVKRLREKMLEFYQNREQTRLEAIYTKDSVEFWSNSNVTD